MNFITRPNTMDAQSVADMREYAQLDISPSDVVLDLGANIGAFTVLAAQKGARVIAVEPEPENFKILAANAVGLHPEPVLIRAAVDTHSGLVNLFLGKPGETMNHSVMSDAYVGLETMCVGAMSLAHLIMVFRPSVIKADIEGSEALLDWSNLQGVRELAIELHPWAAPERSWTSWAMAFKDFRCVRGPIPGEICMTVWKR